MEEVKRILEAREKQLLQWKENKEDALKTAPEGSLRLCKHRKKMQYYHRTNPKDLNGKYIPAKDLKLAQALAQKEYDTKVLRAAEKELKTIKKYLLDYPEKTAEQVYDSLHPERQKLIVPVVEPQNQYIQKWKSVKYEGKGFKENTPEFYTTNGERVRSKSELIIADLLGKENIPYRYEYPVYLMGIGRIYPDFTTLNVRTGKEILWEHLGMMDDAAYAENAIKKILLYEQNGFFPGENLILTYETKNNPINQKLLLLIIQRYLK